MSVTQIDRRTFVAGAAASSLVASSGLASAALADEPHMTPGTYTGRGTGHNGTIVVEVTVSDSSIVDVKFVEDVATENPVIPSLDEDPMARIPLVMHQDNLPFLDSVTSRLGERIVQAQTTDINVVCGATMSSFGYIEAVRDALRQAGVSDDDFTGAPASSDESLEYDADVVVIGGGCSGITAGAAAHDSGANVVLIEKTGRLGGCGSISTSIYVQGTTLQQQAAENGTLIEEYADALCTVNSDELYDRLMEASSYYAKGVVLVEYIKKCPEAVDFICSKGSFDWAVRKWDLMYAADGLGDPMTTQAWSEVASDIDTVLLETCVKEIITNEDGSVAGVRAARGDGAEVIVRAPKVIICTGGYIGNNDMVAEYNNHGVFSKRYSLTQNVGEGLQMAWNIGANKFRLGGLSNHITEPAGSIDTGDPFDDMIPHTLQACPCVLQVNRLGERFRGEDILERNMNASANVNIAAGGNFFSILSQSQVDVLREQGTQGLGKPDRVFTVNFFYYPLPADYAMVNIDAVFDAGIEAGFMYRADTIEELAGQCGMDPKVLRNSVERYEIACENGVDDLFGKNPDYLFPMGDGPYYAVEGICCPYHTMGGLEVDAEHARPRRGW